MSVYMQYTCYGVMFRKYVLEVGTEWAARPVSVNASSTRPGFGSVKFTGVRTFEVGIERMKLNKLESYIPTHKHFSKRLWFF